VFAADSAWQESVRADADDDSAGSACAGPSMLCHLPVQGSCSG
jgi:hypothetical protein